MGFAAAFQAIVDVLEAAGLRVAVRDGDITPPCVYVGRGTGTSAGAPLAGGRVLGAYLYFIPVRGVDNLAGDYETLDLMFDALDPIAWTDLTATWSSVTVKNDSWPCWRVDTSALGVPATLATVKGAL